MTPFVIFNQLITTFLGNHKDNEEEIEKNGNKEPKSTYTERLVVDGPRETHYQNLYFISIIALLSITSILLIVALQKRRRRERIVKNLIY